MQWRERFDAAIAAAQSAVSSGGLTSAQERQLGQVLSYLGTEGDRNAVRISFGAVKGDAFGALVGPNQIKLDMMKIDADFDRPEVKQMGLDKVAEVAAYAIHEATHGRDLATGVFNFRIRLDTPSSTMDWTRLYAAEWRAYDNQSLVYKGLDIRSRDGLWNPSWFAADREVLRQSAIREGAQRSLDFERKQLLERR